MSSFTRTITAMLSPTVSFMQRTAKPAGNPARNSSGTKGLWSASSSTKQFSQCYSGHSGEWIEIAKSRLTKTAGPAISIAAQRRGPESALADVPLSAATLAPGIVLSTWSGEPVTHWGRCSLAVNLGVTAQHHRAPGITKRREPGRSGGIPPASRHERTTNMCPRSGHSMRGRRWAKRSVSTIAEVHKAAAGPGTDSGPFLAQLKRLGVSVPSGAHKKLLNMTMGVVELNSLAMLATTSSGRCVALS
jgi:hypothetical protein